MTKDPFGFTKAINFNKLNDPEVLKELEKIFIKDAPLEERKEFVKKITRLTDDNFIEALTAKVDDQLELEEWRLNNEH